MYENFDKSSPQPCMKYGEQMKHDFLATPTRKANRAFPSTGPAQQEHPNGNEQLIVKKKGSGLLGEVTCKGKAKFETEQPWAPVTGGSTSQNVSTRYMTKKR